MEQKSSVLFVDDDRAMRTAATRLLSHHYALRVARNIDEAMTIVSNEPIDLAIIDVRLESESGIDLAQRLRRSHPTIKVALVSAAHDATSVGLGGFSGALVIVDKSLHPREIARRLEAHEYGARPATDVRPAARLPPRTRTDRDVREHNAVTDQRRRDARSGTRRVSSTRFAIRARQTSADSVALNAAGVISSTARPN